MPPIDVKMTVGRENHRIGEKFAHTNQTSVGEAGWDLSVFSYQI